MVNLIIFDFDGTLADSREIIFSIIKKNLEHSGYSVGKKFKETLGDVPLRFVLAKFGIKNIDNTVKKINQEIIENYKKIKLVSEIKYLDKIKIEKIIMSNNTKEFIEKILKNKKLDFFSEIYGGKKSELKYLVMKELLKKKKLKPSEVIYVGDKLKDVEVARKVGCISMIISHKESWSSRSEILKAKPDFIISNFKELPNIIDKLNSL